jgi:thiol-disulfide isomerase/thioredoxin
MSPRPLAVLAVCLPLLSRALGVGDAAPELTVGKWVQGDPVKALETGKVYIVEFWATWCGPCRATIPHLNDLHKEFKDKGLVVIGQNVWEREEAKVGPFVAKMGEKMTYRVALDDKTKDEKGAMAKAWMEAANQDGIPSAFVVGKDKKIAWIGHPSALDGKIIQAVLDGKFDAEKAAVDRKAEEATAQAGREIFMKFISAVRAENFDDALAVVEEMEKNEDKRLSAMAPALRMNVFAQKKDWAAFTSAAAKVAEGAQDNENKLNELAWALVTARGNDKPDLELAHKWATRANELAKGENPAFLDTLARVKFMKGDKEEAVKLEEKALAMEKEDKTVFEITLGYYKKGELPSAEQLQKDIIKAQKRVQDKEKADRPGEDV